jgi:hypothetical protein
MSDDDVGKTLYADDSPEDHAALLVVRLFVRRRNGVMGRLTTVDDVTIGRETTVTLGDTEALRHRVNTWLTKTAERLRRTQDSELLTQ